MNHHSEWIKAELTRLMKEAAAKIETAQTPAEIDLESCRQRAYKQVYNMIGRMERQAYPLQANIEEGGRVKETTEADNITIQHTADGRTLVYYADTKGAINFDELQTGQDLTISTNPIINRYKLED